MNNLIILFTTGFYSGYFPIASGTAGSFVGVVLYLLMNRFLPLPYYGTYYGIVTFVLFILGILASSKAEIIFGKKDSGKIVIDEIVGFMVTMFAIPSTLKYVLAGFFLFRVFDIIKPFPIRRFEKLEGGLGVMLDDFIAGIYVNLILHGWKYLG